MKTVFTGTTNAINSVSLPYTVTATVGGAGLHHKPNLQCVVWSSSNSASNNIVSYSVNIKSTSSNGVSYCIPSNIYGFGSVLDMGSCHVVIYLVGDSGDTLLTANFVVPSLCQLNSTSTDFGNINDIGTTSVITQRKGQ